MNNSTLSLPSSLFFHSVIVGIIVLFQSTGSLDLINESKNKVTIVKSAIKVDVVGMPKHTIKELNQMQREVAKGHKVKKVEVKVENKEPIKEGDLLKAKKEKLSFKDMIKDLSKKAPEVKKNKVKKAQPVKSIHEGKKVGNQFSKRLNKLILEGNKISKGSSLVGDASDSNSGGEFEEYILKLPDHVRSFWKLPSYLMDKELRCRINIFINSSGDLVQAKLIESSEDEEFDKKAIQAVQDAAPFPTPPASIVKRLISGEVILGFPL